MVEEVRRLGPLGLPKRFAEWDREMIALERDVSALNQEAEETKEEVAHA